MGSGVVCMMRPPPLLCMQQVLYTTNNLHQVRNTAVKKLVYILLSHTFTLLYNSNNKHDIHELDMYVYISSYDYHLH